MGRGGLRFDTVGPFHIAKAAQVIKMMVMKMNDGGEEPRSKRGQLLIVLAAAFASAMTQLIGSGDNNGDEMINLRSK